MKSYFALSVKALLWPALFVVNLHAQSQPKNDISGIWKGQMAEGVYFQLNIVQNGNYLCGYSYDYIIDRPESYCKEYFSATFNQKRNRWELLSTSFIENAPHSEEKHLPMRLDLIFTEKKGKKILKGTLANQTLINSITSVFSFKSRDGVFLEKVDEQIDEVLPGMMACYQELDEKEKFRITRSKVKNAKESSSYARNKDHDDDPVADKDKVPVLRNTVKKISETSADESSAVAGFGTKKSKRRYTGGLTAYQPEPQYDWLATSTSTGLNTTVKWSLYAEQDPTESSRTRKTVFHPETPSYLPSASANGSGEPVRNSVLPTRYNPATMIRGVDPQEVSEEALVKDRQQLTRQMQLRANEKVETFQVNVKEVTISIYDNGIIDDDTVTVFLNREIVLAHQRLTSKAMTIHVPFTDSQTVQEITLMAENLGRIAPNTAYMVITAGGRQYSIKANADLSKNASLYLKYVP